MKTPERGDKDYLASLDRRISEQGSLITSTQRDFTEVSHEIKEVLNRINGGLSPSVNEVRKENAEIKMQLKDLGFKIDGDLREMKNVVREATEHTRLMIENFEKHRLTPVASDVGFIKKTFIYGAVGAMVVFAGEKTLNALWQKFFGQHAIGATTIFKTGE